MWRRIAKLIAGLLLAPGVIAVVFIVGMRTKSPLVLNAVCRSGRATKPLVLKSSGKHGGIASVIRYVGRTTGRPYETPVQAVATDDGFVIALPYGPNPDWLKKVRVSGSATIVHEGGPIACSALTSASWFGAWSRSTQQSRSAIRLDA